MTSDPTEALEALTSAFTRRRYEAICINKTSLYSFVLPVLAGLRLAGIADGPLEARLTQILLKFGFLFQAQDDFLDCFGDPSVTGKTGTDIQEGKCTWLIVEAVARANVDLKQRLARAYGGHEDEAVTAVKNVYAQLSIPTIFHEFESKMRKELEEDITDLKGHGFSASFLRDLLQKMERRQK